MQNQNPKEMLTVGIVISLIFGGFVGYLLGGAQQGMYVSKMGKNIGLSEQRVKAEMDFKQAMRKLWEDHVTWTRLVIIDIADGLKSGDTDTARLLKNYDDMVDALKPYYGDKASENLGDLLEGHLKIAAELVTAAKAGNADAAADAEKRWYANAELIATFLSDANPAWPKQALLDMLNEHLSLTKAEAVARLTQNYPADVAAYDQIHNQALMMADALSGGIIKQFPNKF